MVECVYMDEYMCGYWSQWCEDQKVMPKNKSRDTKWCGIGSKIKRLGAQVKTTRFLARSVDGQEVRVVQYGR